MRPILRADAYCFVYNGMHRLAQPKTCPNTDLLRDYAYCFVYNGMHRLAAQLQYANSPKRHRLALQVQYANSANIPNPNLLRADAYCFFCGNGASSFGCA